MTDALFNRVASLSCFDNPQDITLLGGGLTNVNMRVMDGDRHYVVRIGADIPEHGVLRWNELALSKAASAAGFSPQVLHHEPGVLVLDYLEAKTFQPADARASDNLHRIIALIGDMHRGLAAHLTQPVLAFWPFQVNRSYIARLAQAGSAHAAALPAMLAQIDTLEKAVGQIDMVIGHNDLLAANILDDGRKLWLIDWEYGGFNSPLFDLAGLASNNGLTEPQERAMLEQYFSADPDRHWRPYKAMTCISLMRETLWSMTSEIHSGLDVDYAAYTAENMGKFMSAFADFSQA